MESAILIILALGGLGAVGVGVILLVVYLRGSSRNPYSNPVVYGNLVQCPRCNYMNPLDSGACLNCRLPLQHSRQPYQAPPSPTHPTLPPQYPQRPMPPANAPAHYAAPTQAQPQATAPRPTARRAQPPDPHTYDPVAASGEGVTVPAPPPRGMAPAANRPANMPRAWLEGIAGVAAGQHMALNQPEMVFGRSTQCDVQVYDPKVSRQHFSIRYGNGVFVLQDLDSSSGTHINGKAVWEQQLRNGDQIQIGDSAMIFRIEP